MLVLLPPSEGKTAPASGPALDLAALSAPGLTPMREKVLDALVEVSARDDARQVLGVGARLEAEVARNTGLRDAPTARAARVYTGVLYEAAGLDDLSAHGLRLAERTVRIFSGLWGVVSPSDRIPAYRLSMGTDLPGIGPLAGAWRSELADALDARAAHKLVVDCRSATYLAAWRPPATAQWVRVRVVRDRDGVRTVVSHHAKHLRGVLTRHLLTRSGSEPLDPDALAAAALEIVGTPQAVTDLVGSALVDVELDAAGGHGDRGRVLSLVVR